MLSWTVCTVKSNAASLKVTVTDAAGVDITPTSDKFADFTALKPFANAYGANETDLSQELHQAKRLVERLDSVEKPKSRPPYVGVNFVSRTVQRSIPITTGLELLQLHCQ